MKKTIILLSLAVAGLTSCDNFLTEDLKGDYSSETIFSTESHAQEVVNSIYNAAAYSINLWRFGDVASDDATKGGDAGDQADLTYIEDFSATSDNGVLSEFWQNTYETISRANNAIAGITGKGYENGDRMMGEAKFLRAYSYFQLVNIFGRVPLKLQPQETSSAIYVDLSSVTAIYAQIEQDLTEAAASLPASYDATNQGRATKGAALGLLAKAQLYQGKYSEALSNIQKIKDLNIYHLDSYANLFKLGNESSPEVLFAIRFSSNQVPKIGNSLNQYFAPLDENGYYFNNPTSNWLASFKEKTVGGADDPRIDVSIGREGHTWTNGEEFKTSWSTTGYLVKKHNQPLAEVPTGTKGDGGLAYIYLRYADILLMEAECQNELGETNKAATPLNDVRGRVGLPEKQNVSTQSAMRAAIRLERRHELGFEFHRFFDLMRYGQDYAKNALVEKTENPVTLPTSSTRFYYPIPQSELDANPAIK